MEDLEMRKICAKIVPKLLISEQKFWRKQCCIDWKTLEEKDAFLDPHRWWTVDLPESTTLLKGLKEDDFQGCFNQWKRMWDKCIASEGEYFEGDKNDVPDNT
jgi:hypothetical protein